MPATLRHLLDEPRARLRLLTPGAARRGARTPDASWVHSSDLADPTPFLSDGQVLLTTGTQFPAEPAATSFYRATSPGCERAASSGSASAPRSSATARPTRSSAACRAQGLPLFEVPYRTPFIARRPRSPPTSSAEDSYARRHLGAARPSARSRSPRSAPTA